MKRRLPQRPEADRWDDYFEPGERLLWQGAPEPGLKMAPLMVFLSLFGVPFLGAGVAVFASGLHQAAQLDSASGVGFGLFLTVFGLPFIAMGAGLVFGPWYAALTAHRKVRYALSDRRAYIAKSWWNHTLESYRIRPDEPVELVQGRNDTVWFHVGDEVDSDGDRATRRAGFENIADGRKVYGLLRAIQRDGQ